MLSLARMSKPVKVHVRRSDHSSLLGISCKVASHQYGIFHHPISVFVHNHVFYPASVPSSSGYQKLHNATPQTHKRTNDKLNQNASPT